MSTRIYKGFRLNMSRLADVLALVESFRPWVEEQANQAFDTFMDNMSKEGADAIKAFDTWQELRRLIRVQQQRVPQVDTDFTVLVIPSGEQMLGIVYTERQAWFDAWCKLPGVEEFGYWDNTDQPDGVSDDEWDARSRAWSVLGSNPVSMQGFSIELVSLTGPLPKSWR